MNNEQLAQAQADLADGTVDALARQLRAYHQAWTLGLPGAPSLRVLNTTLAGAREAQAAIQPVRDRYNHAVAVHNGRVERQRTRRRAQANEQRVAAERQAVRTATCGTCHTVHKGECW